MHPKVLEFLSKQKYWSEALIELRNLLVECGLTETFKWRNPCYAMDGKNIAILGAFKDFCCLSFFKGVLLSDPEGILKQQGGNTQSGRIVPFTNVKEINGLKPILKTYVLEAIEIEKSGLKLEYSKPEEMEFPEELELAFKRDKTFETAFKNLTPGRQKGYLLFFTGAKQSATRASRITKFRTRILDGKGIHDCVCGLSKKMPACDGSHKYI